MSELPAIPVDLPEFGSSNENQGISPLLSIDSGAGKNTIRAGSFIFAGVALDNVELVFITRHEYRRLHRDTYKESPNSPVVCISWDGLSAFGTGARKGTEYRERTCQVEDSGRRIRECPLAKNFDCKPNEQYLVMIRFGEMKTWTWALFSVTGQSVTPSGRAFQAAKVKAAASINVVDGKKMGYPIFCWSVRATLQKATRAGYWPVYTQPELVPKAEWPDIVSFVRGIAVPIWDEEIERMKSEALALKAEGDPQGSDGQSDDIDKDIPF